VCLQVAELGFPEPGYIEITSPNLTQDASLGFSFQTDQSDALLLLAKGSVAVSCYCWWSGKFVAPENNSHMQQYGLKLKLGIGLKLGLRSGLRVGLRSGLGLGLRLGFGLGVVHK